MTQTNSCSCFFKWVRSPPDHSWSNGSNRKLTTKGIANQLRDRRNHHHNPKQERIQKPTNLKLRRSRCLHPSSTKHCSQSVASPSAARFHNFFLSDRTTQTTPVSPEIINFKSALVAHRSWLEKLRTAIEDPTAAEKLDVTEISDDRRCPLGKWLWDEKRETPFPTREMFVFVCNLHHDFHTATGRVVTLAQQQGPENRKEAMELLESSTSAFNVSSQSLCGIVCKLAEAQAAFFT